MVKVVADAGLYVTALSFGGAADDVLGLGRRRRIALFVSSPILNEIGAILIKGFAWSRENALKARIGIRGFAQFVKEDTRVAPNRRLGTARAVLDCAVEAEAQFVITGDPTLRRLRRFEGIVIVSPSRFLELRPYAGKG